MNVTLPDAIQCALRRPADYSPAFSRRMGELARALEVALSTFVAHDADMNYRAGQSLSFISTDSVESPRHPIEVRIYVSSRADVFAFYCFDVKHAFMPPGTLNHPMPLDLAPTYAQRQLDICRAFMIRQGHAEVSAAHFNIPAPDCVTQIDGLPASVFEALFAEVV